MIRPGASDPALPAGPKGPALHHAHRIAEAVRDAGGRALIVGGWVRDRIMALGQHADNVSKDIDIEVFGVPADRLRTVSYGKEFPFEPGHEEGSWSKNRRAHFVVTSK